MRNWPQGSKRASEKESWSLYLSIPQSMSMEHSAALRSITPFSSRSFSLIAPLSKLLRMAACNMEREKSKGRSIVSRFSLSVTLSAGVWSGPVKASPMSSSSTSQK